MDILLKELVTEMLWILIQIIITILGGYIINYLRTKVGSEKMKQFADIAQTVVKATEQTLGGGNGADKKAESVQILKHLTHNKLNEEQIDRLIEAAVYEMNILLKMNGLKNSDK